MKVFAALFVCLALAYGVSGYKGWTCQVPADQQPSFFEWGSKYIVVAFNKANPLVQPATTGSCGMFTFSLTEAKYFYDGALDTTANKYTVKSIVYIHGWMLATMNLCNTNYYVAYVDATYIMLKGCSATSPQPFIVLRKATPGVATGSTSAITDYPTAISTYLTSAGTQVQNTPDVVLCSNVYAAT